MAGPRTAARWLLLAARNFFDHRAHLLAAAISFYSLLSLLPLLYFSILLLGAVMGSSSRAVAEVTDFLHRILPMALPSIQKQVSALVGGGRLPNVLAAASLLGGTGMAFVTVETAVAQIQGRTPGGRRVLRGIVWSYLAVLAASALSVLTHLVSAGLSLAARRGLMLGGVDVGRFGQALFVRWSPMLAVLSAFFLLLYLAPERRPPWRWTAVVAVALTGLWEAMRVGFRWYTAHVVPLSLIYGPLASIMAFLLFVYLSAVLYLLGVEYLTLAWRAREGEGA